MKELLKPSIFTVPLGTESHRLAQKFSRQHDCTKAKQVYLNTLAVYATKFYLSCIGVKTDWSNSFSWDSVWQNLMDVADLEIPNLGKLECRPVLPDIQVVPIPPEVWSERIGYVAVQLDSALQEATLLGFTQTASKEELPLTELESLEELLAHLNVIGLRDRTQRINLSQWFENTFDAGWQSLEALFSTDVERLSFGLRSDFHLRSHAIKGAKIIDLGLELGSQSVVMLIAIAPEVDDKVGILVHLHPGSGENYLLPKTKLILLSDSGVVLQEVQSRSQDNYIQLKQFRGNYGECFSIQVAASGVNVTETFQI